MADNLARNISYIRRRQSREEQLERLGEIHWLILQQTRGDLKCLETLQSISTIQIKALKKRQGRMDFLANTKQAKNTQKCRLIP